MCEEKTRSIADAAHGCVGSASLDDVGIAWPLADASGYCLSALRACLKER
jgi:hypothetical protein